MGGELIILRAVCDAATMGLIFSMLGIGYLSYVICTSVRN